MGKTMLLRKIFSEQKDNLVYFKKGIDRPGFLDECKSFLCELEQYGIREKEQFEKMETLGRKFEDIHRIHDCFKEKMGDTYQMAEELTGQLTLFGNEEERKLLSRYGCSRNLKMPEKETHEYRRRTVRKLLEHGPTPTEGYYIDQDSIRCGVNPYTGKTYFYYTEIKMDWDVGKIKKECDVV